MYSLNVAGSSLLSISQRDGTGNVSFVILPWFQFDAYILHVLHVHFSFVLFRLKQKKLCLPERVYIYLVSCFENV